MPETTFKRFEEALLVVNDRLDDDAAYIVGGRSGEPPQAPKRVESVTSGELAASRELVQLVESVSRQGLKVNVHVEVVDAPDDTLASYGNSAPLRALCVAQRDGRWIA